MTSRVSRRSFLGAAAGGAGAAAMATVSTHAGEAGAMPLRPLGKTGRMISVLGFGGGSQYLNQADLAVAERMIHRAIELGVNYFDTAHSYRKGEVRESQLRYGRFLIPKYRARITLTSKLNGRDAETVKKQLDETLSDLKTDRLDVLHFHSVTTTEDVDKIVAPDGALKAYRQFKDQGIIGAIGVSGHQDSKVILDAMKRIQPDCVMCPQNPLHGAPPKYPVFPGANFAEDVIPYGREHGIGLLAMKTTAQGKLAGKGGIRVEELVRYAMTLPVAAAVIGIPDLEVLESCVRIAKTLQPMSDEERERMRKQLAAAADVRTLPYLACGYKDGDTGLA